MCVSLEYVVLLTQNILWRTLNSEENIFQVQGCLTSRVEKRVDLETCPFGSRPRYFETILHHEQSQVVFFFPMWDKPDF